MQSDGRFVGSRYAQRMCGIAMHPVDRPSYRDSAWRDILIDDPHAGPGEPAEDMWVYREQDYQRATDG